MINNKKVTVVLPAYNAAKTLEKTIGEIPFDIVDDIILCDDNSTDNTVELAKKLNINHIISHNVNKGYWCPYCLYKNEEECRLIFETFFDKKFIAPEI